MPGGLWRHGGQAHVSQAGLPEARRSTTLSVTRFARRGTQRRTPACLSHRRVWDGLAAADQETVPGCPPLHCSPMRPMKSMTRANAISSSDRSAPRKVRAELAR